MQNAPRPSAEDLRFDDPGAPGMDERPTLRVTLLGLWLCVPLTLIASRLAHLQLWEHAAYAAWWDTTTEDLVSVAAAHGRILTSDGTVLAEDVRRFDVAVHYRWLEVPPDPDWLTGKARGRQSASGDESLESAEADVLVLRERMWAELAAVTGRSLPELQRARGRIQKSVDRIYSHVAQRRQEKRAPAQPETAGSPWWRRVVAELAPPPARELPPLVIREQEDYHVVAESVPLAVAANIEAHPGKFPGVRVLTAHERVYPAGTLAAHLIGARTPIDAEQLQARRDKFPAGDPQDYREGDRIGRSGIERSFETRLRGRRGVQRIVRDLRGEIVATEMIRPPRAGHDLVLAIDAGLQSTAERLLDERIDEQESAESQPVPQGGCLVAIDVRTGELLAAAAAPRFDPMLYVQFDAEKWATLTADSRRPFFPRLTQAMLPPGSVFKTVTAVALLESGRQAGDVHFCRGYLDRPDRNRCYIYRHFGVGHGDVDLTSALTESCNVYFFHAARQIGPDAIAQWAQRMGLGQSTGIELTGEKAGHVPMPDSDPPWYPGTTLQLAIGQASLTVTPLQVARLMAAIANDGWLVTPRLVSADQAGQPAEFDPHLTPVLTTSPPKPIAGISTGTLSIIRHGLEQVVAHPKGTGKGVRLDQVKIAGKTGTAEVGGSMPDHAWFAGYVPADKPQIAFAVVLEHGGSGGKAAGPVAKEFVEALLEAGVIEPQLDSLQTEGGGMP